MTDVIGWIVVWWELLFWGAVVMALIALVALLVDEHRSARGAGVVTGAEILGRDQVTPERRAKLRELQARVAARDPRRV